MTGDKRNKIYENTLGWTSFLWLLHGGEVFTLFLLSLFVYSWFLLLSTRDVSRGSDLCFRVNLNRSRLNLRWDSAALLLKVEPASGLRESNSENRQNKSESKKWNNRKMHVFWGFSSRLHVFCSSSYKESTWASSSPAGEILIIKTSCITLKRSSSGSQVRQMLMGPPKD